MLIKNSTIKTYLKIYEAWLKNRLYLISLLTLVFAGFNFGSLFFIIVIFCIGYKSNKIIFEEFPNNILIRKKHLIYFLCCSILFLPCTLLHTPYDTSELLRINAIAYICTFIVILITIYTLIIIKLKIKRNIEI